jgi:hypothetical protein
LIFLAQLNAVEANRKEEEEEEEEGKKRNCVTPWNKALLEKLIVQAVEYILILLNSRVHYHIHGGPPLDPVLNQFIQSTTLHLPSVRCISILSSHQHLGLPCGVFRSRFPTKMKEASWEIYGHGDNSGAFAHFSLFAAETVGITKKLCSHLGKRMHVPFFCTDCLWNAFLSDQNIYQVTFWIGRRACRAFL